MARIINEPCHTFNEYLLIPGYTPITMNIPMVSAIMQSVSGDRLAVALAIEGGVSFIYGSQSVEDEAAMVKRAKTYKAGFVRSDSNISPDATVLFNGDASINDVTFNVLLSDGTLRVFTIDFGVDPTMGVNEHSSGRLVVWPNPVAHSLFLEGVDDELVNVYDNTGRMVLQGHYNGHLNVSALPKGVYSVTVAGRTVKFVKD